jgi:hypothetical protein
MSHRLILDTDLETSLVFVEIKDFHDIMFLKVSKNDK